MHLHILGICGTFMGSLALLARDLGHQVTGSDLNVYPPMSTQLENAGITLMQGYDRSHLQPHPDLVIVGNAMKRGIDAVEKYRTDGMIWTCNCGHVNEAGSEECVVCHRKQKDMKVKTTFNYEEMIDKMKEKEYVIEIKDVLMEYIKDIDAKYRLKLLEIMESGLQYEKTRGNMKESVIEKVEKVFEEDVEQM